MGCCGPPALSLGVGPRVRGLGCGDVEGSSVDRCFPKSWFGDVGVRV